jgi:hypothetical protein
VLCPDFAGWTGWNGAMDKNAANFRFLSILKFSKIPRKFFEISNYEIPILQIRVYPGTTILDFYKSWASS